MKGFCKVLFIEIEHVRRNLIEVIKPFVMTQDQEADAKIIQAGGQGFPVGESSYFVCDRIHLAVVSDFHSIVTQNLIASLGDHRYLQKSLVDGANFDRRALDAMQAVQAAVVGGLLGHQKTLHITDDYRQ